MSDDRWKRFHGCFPASSMAWKTAKFETSQSRTPARKNSIAVLSSPLILHSRGFGRRPSPATVQALRRVANYKGGVGDWHQFPTPPFCLFPTADGFIGRKADRIAQGDGV